MKGRINRPTPGVKRVVLPRVGFIKVGLKEVGKNGKEYPKSVDYFIPTGKYAGLFTQAYGGKPQTIQIVFPDDDPEKVCNEMYEYRDDDGRRIAYGDGETFFVWNGKQYCQYSTKDYPNLMAGVAEKHPNRSVLKGGDGWVVTLTVTFIIPLVRGVAGVWQFITKGSASTIPNIRDTFDAMLHERGFVKGIVWDMNVQFAISQKPGVRSRYPVVSIVPNESEGNLRNETESFMPVKLLE
jgi:hypothetical protein